MKRAGFTMIELIFVIVILGILAAVAVPKLAATRTDAKVAKGAAETAMFLSELGSFYTAQGTFYKKSTDDITNIKLKAPDTDLRDNNTVFIVDDLNNSCIQIKFNDVADGNITLKAGTGKTQTCKGIQAATSDLMGNHDFGATKISL